MAFDIQPISRFSGSGAAIRRPKEINCFSYDEEHQYHCDDRSLRYYYPPRLPADLSKGFNVFDQLDDSNDDHLEGLLKTITELEKRKGKCVADIVTWRGMMTKIMATPYDNMGGNGFEMNATFFQGTIFIEENHQYKLEQRAAQNQRQAPQAGASQDLMSYWGYKFETLSLLPEPWHQTSRDFIEGREDMMVRNHAQYCSVVKTGIGKARLIIGGEVDAIWDSKPSNPDGPINWVELKTSASIENDRGALKYERKLLKFWIQSFLLGVPKIIVGFRSQHGMLERLEELETQSLPGRIKKSGRGSWDGNVCINFTASFVEWLKNTITAEGVWRIRRRERSSCIEVFKVEETGHGAILSNDFVDWRISLEESNGKSQTA